MIRECAKNIVRRVTYMSPTELRCVQETLHYHGILHPAPPSLVPRQLQNLWVLLPCHILISKHFLTFAVLALNIYKYMEQLHHLDLHYNHGFGMQL